MVLEVAECQGVESRVLCLCYFFLSNEIDNDNCVDLREYLYTFTLVTNSSGSRSGFESLHARLGFAYGDASERIPLVPKAKKLWLISNSRHEIH